MKKFGDLGFADSSGQSNQSVDRGQRRKGERIRNINATPFKAFFILRVISSIKIKKKTKEFEAKVKREAKKRELLREDTKSQAKKIEKLQNGFIKLKEDVSVVALGYARQNDRMKEAEKLLSNICLTDMIRILGEAESDVRAPTPTTSAFQ